MTITPDQFAEVTCEDLRLPTSTFIPLISSSIKEQIRDYLANVSSTLDDQELVEENDYDKIIQFKKQSIQQEVMPEEIMDQVNNKAELRTVIKVFSLPVIFCVTYNYVA